MAGPWEKYADAPAADATAPWEKYKETPAAPERKKEPESPYSFKNLAGAAVEPMLTMATGAPAAVAGGLAGLGQSMWRGVGLGGERDPGQVAQSVQNRFTYQPRTEGGKTAMGAIGYPFQKMGELSEASSGRLSDVASRAGLPPQMAAGLGATGKTAMDFLPQLLLSKGAGTLEKPPSSTRATPAVAELAKRDIPMTPGQIGGPQWSKAESAVEKWPLVGAPIKTAKIRGIEEFARSALDDAMKPVGAKVPPGLKGREAIAHVKDDLGARYDALQERMSGSLHRTTNQGPPNMSGPPSEGGTGPWPPPAMGPTLAADLAKISQKAGLPRKYQQELDRIFQKEITENFDKKSGLADGETLKKIESQLTAIAKDKGRGDQYQREQAVAIRDARKAFREMLGRENPQYAQELQALNEAYSKFKIAEKAASYPGAREGVFTPAQYERAVREKDISKDKAAFAAGRAPQQKLAQAGKTVLSEYLPDSGTPYQLALIGEVLGGMIKNPAMLAAGITTPMLYSRPGMALAQRLMTNPPTGAGVAGAQALPFGIPQQ